MDGEVQRRRDLKRHGVKPKFLGEILRSLIPAQFSSSEKIKEEIMRKALCKRLAGRTVVINRNVFSFDKDGMCPLIINGRFSVVSDFEILLSRSGISEIVETKCRICRNPVVSTPPETHPEFCPSCQDIEKASKKASLEKASEKKDSKEETINKPQPESVVIPEVKRRTVRKPITEGEQ